MRLLYVTARPDRRPETLETLRREVRDYRESLVTRAERLARHLDAALADDPAALEYALDPARNATMRVLATLPNTLERARRQYARACQDATILCQHTCHRRAAYEWNSVGVVPIYACRDHLPGADEADGPDPTRPCRWDVAADDAPRQACGEPASAEADDVPLCAAHYRAWLDADVAVGV